jgi:hypothetical protein
MSGRIETISSRNGNDYKFSKNEIVGAHKAGVDIGEDLEAGGAKTVGKVTIKPMSLKRTTFAITGVVDPEPEQEEETNE